MILIRFMTLLILAIARCNGSGSEDEEPWEPSTSSSSQSSSSSSSSDDGTNSPTEGPTAAPTVRFSCYVLFSKFVYHYHIHFANLLF